jgi:hypothetical protein
VRRLARIRCMCLVQQNLNLEPGFPCHEHREAKDAETEVWRAEYFNERSCGSARNHRPHEEMGRSRRISEVSAGHGQPGHARAGCASVSDRYPEDDQRLRQNQEGFYHHGEPRRRGRSGRPRGRWDNVRLSDCAFEWCAGRAPAPGFPKLGHRSGSDQGLRDLGQSRCGQLPGRRVAGAGSNFCT